MSRGATSGARPAYWPIGIYTVWIIITGRPTRYPSRKQRACSEMRAPSGWASVTVQRYPPANFEASVGHCFLKPQPHPTSVSVSHSLTPPMCKIRTSPVWEDRSSTGPAWDAEWPWSYHHEVMAHLRGYSHQGWVSSQVCSWLGRLFCHRWAMSSQWGGLSSLNNFN